MEKCFERTKWNFWKLFKYAIDGIINFSEVPLSIASWFGIIMTFIDFIFIVLIIVRKLCFGDPVSRWASTACIIIFVGAIQLFCMGVMGQYIAKTYTEVKKRPHYIISWIFAVLFAFCANRKMVFRSDTHNIIQQFIRFLGARLATLVIDMASMAFL